MSLFYNLLKINNIGPEMYLKEAKQKAIEYGIDPNLLKFSTRKNNKLMYDDKVHFGNPEFLDYILYKIFEKHKLIPEGTADKRKKSYLSRATKIKGNWKENVLSPNNLSINILW